MRPKHYNLEHRRSAKPAPNLPPCTLLAHSFDEMIKMINDSIPKRAKR